MGSVQIRGELTNVTRRRAAVAMQKIVKTLPLNIRLAHLAWRKIQQPNQNVNILKMGGVKTT